MTEVWRSPCGAMELRLGRWQEALADVEACDAVIGDWPFSARAHSGQRTGSSTRKTTLTYDALTEAQVAEAVESWAPRIRWWFLAFSDHTAQRWWEASMGAAGLYTFAPLPWLRQCPTPRISGDGPTSGCDYITVARPRHRLPPERSGSRPGYYVSPPTNGIGFREESTHPGSKMLDPMRALIRDYTLPGDLIVDPTAGSGTTLLAAAIEGRRAIGAEADPAAFGLASRRLKKGFTPVFPGFLRGA